MTSLGNLGSSTLSIKDVIQFLHCHDMRNCSDTLIYSPLWVSLIMSDAFVFSPFGFSLQCLTLLFPPH